MNRRFPFKPRPLKVEDAVKPLLVEQYISLRRQIPLMYVLLACNVGFLSAVTVGEVPPFLSIGAPGILILAAAVRTWVWFQRRNTSPLPADVQRYLRTTVLVAAVLSVGFGGWGLLMFQWVDPARRFAVILYIFVGSIGSCYCLQTLPRAAYLVLVLGTIPVTVCLIVSEDLYQVGIGMNFALIAVLIAGTVSTGYERFTEMLRSRSEMFAEQERARHAEQAAQELAYHDHLTGLPNRRALNERLAPLETLGAAASPFALMILDLDLFKSVNDVHGHAAGDRLLQGVAERLQRMMGSRGAAYRLGGDEFAITLDLVGGEQEGALRLAARVVQDISAPFLIEGLSHYIGASVGISMFPGDASDLSTLMRQADIALYRAKALGRSRFLRFEAAMDAEITRRSLLERELRRDLAADAFQPYYQPIVDLDTGRISGFEMLARWHRPDGALVGPDQFIPIAEETGLADTLLMHLLERACAVAARWPAELTLSINISPVQLKDPGFGDKILVLLARTGFPVRRLAMEITENAIIAEPVNARSAVMKLKDQGAMLVLDDFGTGFSSLQHLRMLPFDKLKIDKSYVQGMASDPEARKLVHAIIELSSILGLGAVAEGVETAGELDALRALGCGEGQGYLFGRPLEAAAVQQLLGSTGVVVESAKPAA
ncbi:EAL domain-containing protein [Sphingomonas sp. PL-96]|uniref:putative bifunctional diguanylate cyclase/phosphodiesterase n=1 Tax=Sphingomonas sp. PL-96 TaxID=2887201 RepID=UPI001E57FD08|nr:EAL domain-containing protein [Sphingomonas sp. PL-96]MCC2976269.1 EAL domain-containing protein [Sphingomonas sp. PL-96]